MAKITANQRQNSIASHQSNIQKEWLKLLSTFTRLSLELKEYAAWKNYNYVNGKNDFDSDDIETLNGQFLSIYSDLQNNMNILAEIGAIPDQDLSVYEANNNKYISDNNINVAKYDKRYQG